jgi:hypothetical protein
MQTAELPTKIYEPHCTDRERIELLAQSDAPMRIYSPAHTETSETAQMSGQ